jgi:hypothetical protein
MCNNKALLTSVTCGESFEPGYAYSDPYANDLACANGSGASRIGAALVFNL